MDNKPPHNGCSTIFPLGLEAYFKLLSNFIIKPFEFIKELQPLVVCKNISDRMVLVDSWWVCGLSSIKTTPHDPYCSLFRVLQGNSTTNYHFLEKFMVSEQR